MMKKLTSSFVALFLAMFMLSATASTSDIEFVDLDGKTVKLADFKGKWVVVNYWATWCPPCRVEMPELGFFYEAHKDKDAIVLGVNYETSDVAKVKAFLDEQLIKFPIVRQKGGADGKNTPFGPLKGLPTSYMVSPEGKVLAARTGMVDQKMLESFIQKYNEMTQK